MITISFRNTLYTIVSLSLLQWTYYFHSLKVSETHNLVRKNSQTRALVLKSLLFLKSQGWLWMYGWCVHSRIIQLFILTYFYRVCDSVCMYMCVCVCVLPVSRSQLQWMVEPSGRPAGSLTVRECCPEERERQKSLQQLLRSADTNTDRLTKPQTDLRWQSSKFTQQVSPDVVHLHWTDSLRLPG